VHEYALAGNTWQASSLQVIDAITPSADMNIISSANAAFIALAAWDVDSDGSQSAVAWKLERRSGGWIGVDSVRLPPVDDRFARLRLASDANLHTVAIGWQSRADANVAFYETNNTLWQHQFSVPEGLNLERSVPMVRSIAISRDNSTALIGTTNAGNGGVVTAFR